MSMRFSDIMKDINSGDVNIHDVYAEEATRQVEVASTMFEYAMTLAMAEECTDRVVQEAAEEEGLPTRAASGAGELATDSVVKELVGFYGVVTSNARKVKAATDRNLKAVIALGKKYGISPANSGDFAGAFARPLAQAIVREYGKGKSVSFVSGVFPAARKTHDMTLAFGNCLARLATVYGISIAAAANDPTVKKQLSLGGTAGEAAGDISGLYKKITKGTLFAKTGFSGEGNTVTSASVSDIVDVISYMYVVNQIAGVVANNAGSAKKAENYVASLCKGKGSDMRKLSAVNDKAKDWCDTINAAATAIVKVLSDAIAALGNLAQGKTKGITEYCVEEEFALDPNDDVFVYEQEEPETED